MNAETFTSAGRKGAHHLGVRGMCMVVVHQFLTSFFLRKPMLLIFNSISEPDSKRSTSMLVSNLFPLPPQKRGLPNGLILHTVGSYIIINTVFCIARFFNYCVLFALWFFHAKYYA